MDKLSVIIPCYNHGKYLREAIESLYSNWITIDMEVMVVDDCSTDDSFDIAINLSKEFGFSIYQMEKNSKLSAVRNEGIRRTNGNIIVCLDSDDKLPPNYLQDNYNNMLMYSIDVSYNNSLMFGATNKEIEWPEFNIETLRRSPFIHCSSMYRKEIWESVGGYDESMIDGWEDYEFWMRAARAGFKFKKCNSTHLFYRQGSTQFSQVHGPSAKLKNVKNYIKKKHAGFYLGGSSYGTNIL